MKIVYEDGPKKISMGIAGDFRRGEPRDIDDELADALLKKQTIKFKTIEDKTSKKKEG